MDLLRVLAAGVRAKPDDAALRLEYAKSCVVIGDLDVAAKQHEELGRRDAKASGELGEILQWFDSLKVKPKK